MNSVWWMALLVWPGLAYLSQWLSTPLGSVPAFAAAGAFVAVLAWRWAWSRKIRPAALLLALPVLWFSGTLVLDALSLSAGIARLFGPNRWVWFSQASSAALWYFCLVTWLRTCSWRWPSAAALELGVAGSIFVRALEAHRDGFINRPFQLVDPLWLKGWDPTPLFLAVGALALTCTAVLALNRPGNRRPWWDLPLLLLFIGALYVLAPSSRVKEVLEKFGFGDQLGKENRLSQSGQQPQQGKSSSGSNQAGGAQPHPGEQSQQQKDDPSFADTQPPPKPRPVAVVIFRDDYEPPCGTYYFRQSTNSQFNGLKLVHSNDARFDRDEASGFPTRYAAPDKQPETLGVPTPQLNANWFLSLQTRVALLQQQGRAFGLDNAVGFWATGNPDPSRFQKAYEVESRVFKADYRELLSCAAGDPSWDAETLEHYLEGPGDRRYRELAGQIIETLPPERRQSPLFKAVAIKLWLDENTTYCLKSPSASAPDPVSDFLFGQRIGYCVYTSHSACYLYRAAGVPARIANGYAVPAQQRADGSSLLIRTNNAHSWPEIYLSGTGWLELDISPKKNLEPEQEQVDNNLQQMMGDMARKNKKENRPEEDRPSFDLQALLQRILFQLVRALPWALLTLWLTLTAWKVGRRLAPWFVAGSSLTRWAYLCALDLLAEQGTVRGVDETREGFARRLSAEVPALADLTALHQRQQLGRGAGATPQQIREVLTACMRQIWRRRVAGWRKWFGWLDAASGLRVR